ncbi:MAG: hypothetical protein ABSB80_08800 [Methanoregula sp.]|uniref:hypothetical protein n=1 Tax=Methanoregula sp. TaxID=2052170 RepID=UPI003D122710
MTHELKKLVKFVLAEALIASAINFLIIYFSWISTISNLAWAFIFVFSGMGLIILFGIRWISIFVSRISFYHRNFSKNCLVPKCFYDFLPLEEEALSTYQFNFPEMFINYLVLSIPLYMTFVYLLNPSNFFNVSPNNICFPNNINEAFLTSLVTIPVYLLSMRLLTNPSNKDFIYFRLIKEFYQNEKSMSDLKERMVSFYFALTASTFFIMVMDIIFKSFILSSQETITFINFYEKFYDLSKESFIPQFSSTQIFLYICAYFVMLFMLTGISEFILEILEPMEI